MYRFFPDSKVGNEDFCQEFHAQMSSKERHDMRSKFAGSIIIRTKDFAKKRDLSVENFGAKFLKTCFYKNPVKCLFSVTRAITYLCDIMTCKYQINYNIMFISNFKRTNCVSYSQYFNFSFRILLKTILQNGLKFIFYRK